MKRYDEHDMLGPFKLDSGTVRDLAPDSMGVYLLASDARNLISYVGRGNIKTRLSRHAANFKGDYFYFKRVRSEAEAFRLECELYHRYGKSNHLDNDIHPARPRGRSDLPFCFEYGCNGEAY